MSATPDDHWPPQQAETVLLIAADALGEARGAAAVAAAGAGLSAVERVGDPWPAERPAAILVELAEAEAAGEAALFAQLSAAVAAGRAGAVVACPPAAVDRVAAALLDGPIDIIVGPDVSERAAAVVLMLARRRRGGVREDPPEDEGEQRRLAEEAARIARALAAGAAPGWAQGPGGLPPAPVDAAPPAEAEAGVRLGHLRRLVRERRLRGALFPAALFADPAWDMLLDLAIARATGARIAVSSLCIAAGVPTTTAIRWIRTMVEAGLFVRVGDPADGRRSFVLLTAAAATAMDAYLARL